MLLDAVTVAPEVELVVADVVVVTPDELVVISTSTGIGLALACWIRGTPVVLRRRSMAVIAPLVASPATPALIEALMAPSFSTEVTLPLLSRIAVADVLSPVAAAVR